MGAKSYRSKRSARRQEEERDVLELDSISKVRWRAARPDAVGHEGAERVARSVAGRERADHRPRARAMSDEAKPAAEIPADQQQALLDTGRLFTALAADPKHRKKVLAIIKEVNPNVPIPELDMDKAIEERIAESAKGKDEKIDALEKKLAEVSTKVARREWIEASGLTEDELVEVETLAKDSGITKGETAIEHWRMRNQLGTPRPTKQAKESDEYLGKLRKVKPTDTVRLKQLALEEGVR